MAEVLNLRIDGALAMALDHMRDENGVNVSAWARITLMKAMATDYPEAYELLKRHSTSNP